MEVTNKNFAEIYPKLKKSILTADYIAIDFEFSGLNTSNKDRANEYDCDELRY
jgi:hypothetical protein